MKKRVLCILMAMAVSVGGVSIPAYANEGYGVEEVGVDTENKEVAEESVSSNNVQTVSTNDLEADTAETTDDIYVADMDELEADETEVETVDIKDVQKIYFQEQAYKYGYAYKYDPTVIEKGNIDCSEGSLTYKVYDNGLRMIIEGNGTLKDAKSLQDKLIKEYKFAFEEYNEWIFGIQELRIEGKMKLPKDSSYMFRYSSTHSLSTSGTLHIVGFENIDTSDVENMSYMFCTNYNLDLSKWNTSKVTNMQGMFSGCKGSINFGTNFDTSNVTDMSHMFEDYTFGNLDLSSFNTYNVKDMNSMFGFTKMNHLDLSSFDTYNVEDMREMFAGSEVETIENPNFRTKPGLSLNLENMFNISQIRKIDLSGLDVTNGSGNGVFVECSGLKEVKLFKCFPKAGDLKQTVGVFDNVNQGVKVKYPVVNGKTWRYVYGDYYKNHGGILKGNAVKDVFMTCVYYKTFDTNEFSKTKTKTINKVKYTFLMIDKKNVGIKRVKTNKKNVVIPSKVKIGKKTYKVTYISESAFRDDIENIEKLTLPDTIEKVPYLLFDTYDKYSALKEVVIGKNVKVIEPEAFMWTNLKKVTFRGKKVKEIGKTAFREKDKKIVVKAPKSKLKAYKKMIKDSK